MPTNSRDELIKEIERIANEISLKNSNIPAQSLDDVKEWVYAIANFIIEDRKRVVEPLLRINGILNIDKCVAETLKNSGIQ